MANEFKLVSLLNNQLVLTAGPALSAGTQSQNTGTVIFSNSNGVSFGLNNGTLTASAVGGAGGGVAISAGTNSTSTGTVVFSNANGVSFGMNTNGVVTGTVQTNYLTTAMASDAGTNFVATSNSSLFQHTSATSNITSNAMNTSERNNYFFTSNNTFANSTHTHGNLALTAINGTSASNGLSLSAVIPVQTAFVFSNSNGVSFGTNASTVTATVKTDYLTTAAISDHSHGAIAFSGTNVSGSFTSASNGLSIQLSGGAGAAGNTGYLSAGTTFASLGTITFGNGNGVSFGIDGQTITASVAAAGGAQTGISSLGNSQTTYTSGQVQFLGSNALTVRSTTGQGFVFDAPVQTAFVLSNSNNVSFGTNGSTVTATATFAQSVQTQNLVSINGSTGNISLNVGSSLSSSTNNSSITFGLASNITTALQSAGAYLTTAANSTHTHGAPSITGSINITSNSNAWSIAIPAFLTTARASNDAVGLNTALTAGPLAWTVNSSGISLNAGSAAGTSSGFGGNSISGSMTHNTAGLNLSLNHPAWLTTAANSTHSHGNPTLNLTNLSGTTASASNGFTLSLSAAAPGAGGGVAIAGSNTTYTSGTVVFRGTNLTVNTSAGGQFIDLSVAAPGAAAENNWVTLLGANVSGNSSASGSTIGYSGINLTLSGTNGSVVNISAPATSSLVGVSGISISSAGSTISVYLKPASTLVPYYPASTAVQTMGAQGVTSASAFYFPISIVNPVVFNRIEQLMTCSNVSTSGLGSGTVTHHFGIFSINGGTALSLISSSSYSVAASQNTISATLSAPVSYETAGGYTYTTFGASSTATAQSLWGTAGNRIMTFGFGNTMSLSEGFYVIGIHQRMSSANSNVGLNFALAGNVMGAAQSAGPMGFSTAAFSATGTHKWPWGVATSTGRALYGGSVLPDTMAITDIAKTLTIMPMLTLISR